MSPRHYIALTAGQLNALREAITARLAGPIEEGGGMNLRETYELAAEALYRDRVGEVAVLLSSAEYHTLKDALSGAEPPTHHSTRRCLKRAVQKLKDTPR